MTIRRKIITLWHDNPPFPSDSLVRQKLSLFVQNKLPVRAE